MVFGSYKYVHYRERILQFTGPKKDIVARGRAVLIQDPGQVYQAVLIQARLRDNRATKDLSCKAPWNYRHFVALIL